jgi:oxygen-independent coproporphyrinogen III oxidase
MTAGIYIHIPFCLSKCRYCSFVSRTWDAALADRYGRALEVEMRTFSEQAGLRHRIDSIFIGGGTPSLLSADQLRSILESCRASFEISADCEISLESNPGTISAQMLRAAGELGVNRISLGAQSFADTELAAIGRIHTADQIAEACKQVRGCGIANLSLDLILGLPGQTETQWKANLESGIGLEPNHISVYMLELDSKVPLYRSVAAGDCELPEDDLVADWYGLTIDLLERADYRQYEISNFARPGCECRHNLKYWQREPVFAFGVAAHSYDGISRYANDANLTAYLDAIEGGRSAVVWRQTSDVIRDLEETIFLGLRLNRGIDWGAVRERFRGKPVASCEAAVGELVGLGLLEWDTSALRLTRRGMLLSNEVFQKFIEPGSIKESE